MSAPEDEAERNRDIYFMTVFLIDFTVIKTPKDRSKTQAPRPVTAHSRQGSRRDGDSALLSCVFPGFADEATPSQCYLFALAFVLEYESGPIPYVVAFYHCYCFRGAAFSRLARVLFLLQACEVLHSSPSVYGSCSAVALPRCHSQAPVRTVSTLRALLPPPL